MSSILQALDASSLAMVLSRLAVSAPLLLVWLAGIGVALARWQAHPRVSLLVLLACALSLLGGLTSSALAALPAILYQRGRSTAQLGVILTAVGLAFSLLSTAAWTLVLVAAFSRRERAATGAAPPTTSA